MWVIKIKDHEKKNRSEYIADFFDKPKCFNTKKEAIKFIESFASYSLEDYIFEEVKGVCINCGKVIVEERDLKKNKSRGYTLCTQCFNKEEKEIDDTYNIATECLESFLQYLEDKEIIQINNSKLETLNEAIREYKAIPMMIERTSHPLLTHNVLI